MNTVLYIPYFTTYIRIVRIWHIFEKHLQQLNHSIGIRYGNIALVHAPFAVLWCNYQLNGVQLYIKNLCIRIRIRILSNIRIVAVHKELSDLNWCLCTSFVCFGQDPATVVRDYKTLLNQKINHMSPKMTPYHRNIQNIRISLTKEHISEKSQDKPHAW